MHLLSMPGKTTFPGKRLSTEGAQISFAWKAGGKTGVLPHVLFVASPVGERPAALVAEERALAGVDALVSIQSVLPTKPLSTDSALEPLLVVMKSRVDQEVAGPFECLAAYVALVRSLVHVGPHVSLQGARVPEHFVAHEAIVSVLDTSAKLRARRRQFLDDVTV